MGARGPLLLFFDGGCGLCHRAVLFVLRRDLGGRFRFAPLGGSSFRRTIPEGARAGLPDSLVLVDGSGRIVTRSDAVIEIATAIGGIWGNLASVGRWIPGPIRDGVYDAIAGVRGALFRPPVDVCPRVPDRWLKRFEE